MRLPRELSGNRVLSVVVLGTSDTGTWHLHVTVPLARPIDTSGTNRTDRDASDS